MQKKNFLWIKKTDHTLQFWPKQSSEINLTQSTKPEDVKRKWKNKIKIPPKTKIDYLKQRGIIESAITNHAAGFYQNRDNENFAFIIITYNGTANIEYNGKLHKLKTNSIMIAPQGSSFIIKNKGKWNFLWLHLKSKFWEAYLGKELRIIENSEIVNDIKSIVEVYINNVYRPNCNGNILNNLAETLFTLLKNEIGKPCENDIEKNLKKFFVEFSNNPKIETTTKSIAKKFKITLYEINKASKNITGHSFSKSILNMRIQIAKNALQNGKNVREASYIAGFPDRYTFSKIFKRVTNISPSSI